MVGYCRHMHLPTPIYKAGILRCTMADAEKRKEDMRRSYSAPGSMSSNWSLCLC
ncbi:DDB1- and CUL4-associated factor 13, partial [Tanacetum coccineum]